MELLIFPKSSQNEPRRQAYHEQLQQQHQQKQQAFEPWSEASGELGGVSICCWAGWYWFCLDLFRLLLLLTSLADEFSRFEWVLIFKDTKMRKREKKWISVEMMMKMKQKVQKRENFSNFHHEHRERRAAPPNSNRAVSSSRTGKTVTELTTWQLELSSIDRILRRSRMQQLGQSFAN